MFSKAFKQGFAEGIFKSTDNAIKTYLDKDYEEGKEVAKEDIKLIRTDSSRYNTEYTSHKKELKTLMPMVENDADALQYILTTYGYDQGKKYISDMHQAHITQGAPSVMEMFELEQRMKGTKGVTIDQLARWHTTPVNVPKAGDYSKLGGGMTRLFGGQDAMKDMIEGMVEPATSGLPGVRTSLDDIPTTLLARDPLEPWETGSLGDPEAETKRLNRLSMDALAAGDLALASRIKLARDLKLLHADVEINRATGIALTEPQKEKFRQSILSTMNEKHKFSSDYDEFGNLLYGDTKPEILEEVNTKADALLAQAIDLMKKGYSSQAVMARVRSAIYSNKKIKIAEDIGKIINPKTANIRDDVILVEGSELLDTTKLIQDITKAVNFNAFLAPTDPFDPIYSESQQEDIRNILRGLDIKSLNNVQEIIDSLVQDLGIPAHYARSMINMMIK